MALSSMHGMLLSHRRKGCNHSQHSGLVYAKISSDADVSSLHASRSCFCLVMCTAMGHPAQNVQPAARQPGTHTTCSRASRGALLIAP